MSFPENFLWGAATASAQIEGGRSQGGRSDSIWDAAPERRIKNGENCHVAADHYHRYKEDVRLMKDMGLKSYRFSISWSRIMPEEGMISPEGIRFYSDLIDELQKAGIEPLVTIYHWDLPLWVHQKGGWLSRRIVSYFTEYTKAVVDAFSDRVTYWMPMNEPQCFIMNGYIQGAHAPFKKRYLSMAKLTRNCMLAFHDSVEVIRRCAKLPPKIGIAMSSGCFLPESESPEDIKRARERSFEEGMGLLNNRWWCDPILLGKGVRAYGVYHISDEFSRRIQVKLDFLGLNMYTPFNYAAWGGDRKKKQAGLMKNSLGWVVDGRLMYYAPKFFYERYHLPILITENGMCDNDFLCLDDAVHDAPRIDYVERHLLNLKKAMEEGIPVLGYQYWSLMDNFEWAEGYDPRFGLIYVDFRDGKRIPKDSFYWYRDVIQTDGRILNEHKRIIQR